MWTVQCTGNATANTSLFFHGRAKHEDSCDSGRKRKHINHFPWLDTWTFLLSMFNTMGFRSFFAAVVVVVVGNKSPNLALSDSIDFCRARRFFPLSGDCIQSASAPLTHNGNGKSSCILLGCAPQRTRKACNNALRQNNNVCGQFI